MPGCQEAAKLRSESFACGGAQYQRGHGQHPGHQCLTKMVSLLRDHSFARARWAWVEKEEKKGSVCEREKQRAG